MSRTHFEEELGRAEREVLTFGELVEGAIPESVRILTQRDEPGSARMIEWDRSINERRYRLEGEILALIATQAPVAGDMRILAALLEIVTELERIADYAKGIARINVLLGEFSIRPSISADLEVMARSAAAMIHGSLDAFAGRDPSRAREVCIADDEVDRLFEKLFHDVVRLVADGELAPKEANYLVWAAHNLERTADRTTNICERVVFATTGELLEGVC